MGGAFRVSFKRLLFVGGAREVAERVVLVGRKHVAEVGQAWVEEVENVLFLFEGGRRGPQRRFVFPPGSVLVVGMVLHVQCAKPLGLVDEGPLLTLGQQLPVSSQPL